MVRRLGRRWTDKPILPLLSPSWQRAISSIPNALQIPQNLILERVDRLPKDRTIVLYCWDTWCSLAAQAAVPLLERGFDVREMYGGMKAWKTLRFPTEPVDESALASQTDPLHQHLP